MSYGHASWIPIVVLAGVFLIRSLSAQRRRGGPHAGGRVPRSPFTGDSRGPLAPPSPTSPPTADADRSDGMPAGWFRDPFVRHEQRFWSGSEWTEHVTDSGVPGTDPPPAAAAPGRPGDRG